MAQTPEGKIKTKLDKVLKAHAPNVWFFPPQSGPYGVAGIPDRVGSAYGKFFGVEAKADKTKKPTPLQLKCLGDIVKSGGMTFIVYDDESIAKVAEWLSWLETCNQPLPCDQT